MNGNPPPADPGNNTPANPAVPPPPATWWTPGADADINGYVTTRGLDRLPANEAFLSTVKAHREAMAKLGVPIDRLVQIPTAGDSAAERAFWQRFGAPAEAKDYAFEGIDDAKTPGLDAAIRETVHGLNMPTDMAAGVAKGVLKYFTDKEASETATRTAALSAEREKLETDWGGKDTPKFNANMEIANRGALSAGVSKEAMDALMAGVGGSAVARMFRDLGVKLGEARYIQDGNNPDNGIMTRDQAVARRFELTGMDAQGRTTGKGDKAWMDKLYKGDADAKREWSAIMKLIAGV